MSTSHRDPIYWSFSGPDSWRLSVAQVSAAFLAGPELIEELQKQATPVSLGSGSVLFRQGEAPTGVYIVLKGSAKLTSRTDGDVVLNLEAGAGSLLGVPAVIGSKPYSLTAEVMDGAEISMVKCEDFVHLMHTDPQLSFRVLQVLAEEVRYAREALSHL